MDSAPLRLGSILALLSGPDWTDLPELMPEKIDFDKFIGAYDLHSYYARFDWAATEGYPLAAAGKRLAGWRAWATARGQPLSDRPQGIGAFRKQVNAQLLILKDRVAGDAVEVSLVRLDADTVLAVVRDNVSFRRAPPRDFPTARSRLNRGASQKQIPISTYVRTRICVGFKYFDDDDGRIVC